MGFDKCIHSYDRNSLRDTEHNHLKFPSHPFQSAPMPATLEATVILDFVSTGKCCLF